MIKTFKVFVALFISALLSSTMYAANHPVTGEKLAADQTFTYWHGDEHSSHDPQILEDTYGSNIARDLFEGLLSFPAHILILFVPKYFIVSIKLLDLLNSSIKLMYEPYEATSILYLEE